MTQTQEIEQPSKLHSYLRWLTLFSLMNSLFGRTSREAATWKKRSGL